MRFLWFQGLLIAVILVAPSVGGGEEFGLDDNDRAWVATALRAIKMRPSDPQFRKDPVASEWITEASRRALHEPLWLPQYADQLRRQLDAISDLGGLARLAGEALPREEIGIADLPAPSPDPIFLAQLPSAVAEAVRILYRVQPSVRARLDRAQPENAPAALAAVALMNLHLEEDPAELESWRQLGLDTEPVESLLARDRDLELQDDEPVRAFLQAADRPAALPEALAILARAADRAVGELRAGVPSREFQYSLQTPYGRIICGGSGPNVYRDEAFLIIDTGGDDLYENSAGGAQGLCGRPVAVVIDLAGNDRYLAGRSFAQGAGTFGIGMLVDLEGDDIYRAKNFSQGSGLFGAGLLVDFGGEDEFEADTHGQGAATFGAGILWQRSGSSHYDARLMAQGFAGTGGWGLLWDEDGSDQYRAGGRYPCDWLPGHHFSLAQGFGFGARPFAGGGTGLLVDGAGNDQYEADVYGQGASYWYALGMLLDVEGNDSYRAYQYCQGAGIHLSSGGLFDVRGDDQYEAHAIAQGGAHDYAVGLLIDRAGNDRYHGDSTAQGSAINNSFALLLDQEGNDNYQGTEPEHSQAAGHDGGRREYGSIALLLDLQGVDTYSQGQTNESCWLKPFHGAGLDVNARKQGVSWPTDHIVVPGNRGWMLGSLEPASRKRPPIWSSRTIDPHHPVERLLRRAVRDVNTEKERQDRDAAAGELRERASEALPYLLRRVDSPSVLVRVKAEELVDHLGTNAVPILIQGIQEAPSDEVARISCYFIARFESATSAVPSVRPLLKHEVTRTTALYTLGHLRAAEAFGPAVRGLDDQAALHRLRATQALGRIGDPRAIPRLVRALSDDCWYVRYAAEDALVSLGPQSVSRLKRVAAAGPGLARPHAWEALARLGEPAGPRGAQRGLRGEMPLVRQAVLQQLADLAAQGQPRARIPVQ